MIELILKELMNYFNIDEELPDYLLNQPFNKVFLDGKFTIKDNTYEIAVKTRQDVIHHLFIKPGDDFPVIVMSELPNGKLNGMKFPNTESQPIPINEL
ncbi:MAG: hypothetical protein J6M91_05905 [Methanobrevibacter sp.]|nr:hypothetical protein [Methanobrevibacter sp.]